MSAGKGSTSCLAHFSATISEKQTRGAALGLRQVPLLGAFGRGVADVGAAGVVCVLRA
jgi:hypothetical protein